MPSAIRAWSAVLALALGIGTAAFAAEINVGGAAMLPSKNIIENAGSSKDHTTLVQAIKAAGLTEALANKGPFTVFAPVNGAFAALSANTIERLLKPENKAELEKVINYHLVSGALTYEDIEKAIKDGGGEAKLTTVAGPMLYARKNGAHNIVIKDAVGGIANISTYEVPQSNGVIYVIDKVLIPGK